MFANPDGSFTAREYAEPVRAVRNGAWVQVDDTLVKDKGGSWRPKAATVDVVFSGGGEGPFAVMRRAGREFTLTWPGGKLPAPRVEGSAATYSNVLPGVDLAVRAEVDGFGHMLVVNTPEAAANPELKRIELELGTQGITLRENASGAVQAVDSAVGGTVFEAAAPAMWDSASATESGTGPMAARSALRSAPRPLLDGPRGGGKTSPLGLEISAKKLTLIPDQKLLRGSGTVFPIVIDPFQRTTSRTAWTSVMSGKPTIQDWKYSGSAGAGKCPTDYSPVSCNGVGVRRLLFTTPMSFYKDKQILKATFSGRVEHVYWADARAEPLQLYRIGGKDYSITSSSSWNTTKDSWSQHLMTVDKQIQPTSCSSQANIHFEGGGLTTQVQSAAAGGWANMTLGLKAENETSFGGWKRICGNTYLSISYNTPPKQISTALMSSNPGGVCAWGTSRPYSNIWPQLRTETRDPDHTTSQTDQVKVQFKVAYTDTASAAQSFTSDTVYKSPNAGTPFTYTVEAAKMVNYKPKSVVYWSARAFDGDAWGEWSSTGTQRCEFIFDNTAPPAPKVVSEQYPDDEMRHDGVGSVGTFTFSPDTSTGTDTEAVEYRYSFGGQPKKTLAAAKVGAPASLSWTPMSAGRHWVTVESFDKAKNVSVPAQYEFLVADGRSAVGQWNLADEAGTDLAHDETGDNPATPGAGVTFGIPGPGGTADVAARFNGTTDAYLDSGAPVLDPRKNFTVSAWVRPTVLSKDLSVVSHKGYWLYEGPFRPLPIHTGSINLGYSASSKKWEFSILTKRSPVPTSEVHVRVASDAPVVAGQWVHLTAVYDAGKVGGPELRLYVNQQAKAVTAAAGTTELKGGRLQIGRRYGAVLEDPGDGTASRVVRGYYDHFVGDLADVRAFDRVLPPAQVADLMTIKPQRKGYWPLDSATNGTSANAHSGGQPLNLYGNASIYQPQDPDPIAGNEPALVGGGHLELDGAAQWAATATPPVAGDAGFTVAVRAQLSALDPEKSQTVLSLPGAAADRFVVRYQKATRQWELAVAATDKADAPVTTFTDDQELPNTGGAGQHLAVVYDAFTSELRLYVEGQLASSARGVEITRWKATAGLQVGRSAQGGGSEYFAGAVDEVRVYDGAVDPVGIARMRQPTPDTSL
ncbi:LamG domain-containing protein [Streptomyces sp. A3M-1-3]|nr:LamG domain-containing protein [Streptomyces sp. A3M-1-3]